MQGALEDCNRSAPKPEARDDEAQEQVRFVERGEPTVALGGRRRERVQLWEKTHEQEQTGIGEGADDHSPRHQGRQRCLRSADAEDQRRHEQKIDMGLQNTMKIPRKEGLDGGNAEPEPYEAPGQKQRSEEPKRGTAGEKPILSCYVQRKHGYRLHIFDGTAFRVSGLRSNRLLRRAQYVDPDGTSL